jgi:hypothetical protein
VSTADPERRESPAATYDLECSVDDPENPEELTIFAPDSPTPTTEWITIEYDAAIPATEWD